MDKPVFCLIHLPEVVKGAVFSRYSRSAKSLRRTLLDDFIKDKQMGFNEIVGSPAAGSGGLEGAVQKAEAFYDRVLVGYGDDSVAELAGAHMGIEGVSNVVTKVIEDARLTSPLEKSTRYVWFDQKESGEYLFYREPVLMRSRFAQDYLRLMNDLFDAYARLKEPITQYIQEKFPLGDFGFKDSETGQEIKARDVSHESKRKQIETAYRSTVKAQACDILRGFLPASTKTNMGLFADGRAFESLLTKLYSSQLAEARSLAASMHEELKKVIPSFVKRAGPSAYISETRQSIKRLADLIPSSQKESEGGKVVLDWYNPDAEVEAISSILYPISQESYKSLRERVKQMPSEERLRVLQAYFGSRATCRTLAGTSRDALWRTFITVLMFWPITASTVIFKGIGC